MSAYAVVFATNGSGGGDTKAARKYLSNVEGTARTCTQVSVTCTGHNALVVRIRAACEGYLLDELTMTVKLIIWPKQVQQISCH